MTELLCDSCLKHIGWTSREEGLPLIYCDECKELEEEENDK